MRGERLVIRVSAQEHALVAGQAQHEKLAVATYVRRLLLQQIEAEQQRRTLQKTGDLTNEWPGDEN